MKLIFRYVKSVVFALTMAVFASGVHAEVKNVIEDVNEGWTITTDDFISTPYYGAMTGNGGIGIIPWKKPFTVKDVVLNHVFDTKKRGDVSSVLKGINPFNLAVTVNGSKIDSLGVNGWSQTLDMRKAVHSTRFRYGNEAEISYDVRALRNMPYAGVMTVKITALKNIRLGVSDSISQPASYQTSAAASETVKKSFKKEGARLKVIRRSALSKYRDVAVSASAGFIFEGEEPEIFEHEKNRIGFTLDLKKRESISFALVGSVCSARDFLDPYNESDRQVSYIANEGLDRVIARHDRLWDELWEGDVVIEGDDEAQKAVRFSLYNLYSSARKGSRLSIPPFGLSATGYNGHIFWDTELWMYPPMLFLNQGIAESMMDYRIDRLDGARKRALAYGYDGAMFPWESDDAGEESCPVWALTGAFEHHITADVAIAAWNFYLMNRDMKWLETEGYPLLADVADFWKSRVEKNADGSYSIRNVVCADEYAQRVDDNAFTNGAVIKAMQAAVAAAKECGVTPDPEWQGIADRLRILKSLEGITLEHEGYEGKKIKQADVNLLGYPLGVITDEAQLRRDLEYYERVMDPKGPAMSFAVLAIQHARLGEGDKAYELFVRSFRPNQLPPFGVVSEGAGGTNPYFTTGAGGFLQAVINGFCGLELTAGGVTQLPSSLPAHWKSVTVKGVGPTRQTFTRTQEQ